MKPIYFFSLLFILFSFVCAGFAQSPDRQQIQQQIQEQRKLQSERNQNRQNQSEELQEQPQQPIQRQSPDPARRTTRQRSSEAASDKTVPLTERAKIKNLDDSRVPAHAVWLREIMKMIDLDKGENAALKYPVQPIGNRVNLFTLLFQLMSDNRIDMYRYILDRDPVFAENTKISFEDILKTNQIPYVAEGTGDNTKFIVDEMDIPSQDVTKYFIKEDWFFDEATGSFNSRVTAICPIMVRIDYNDNTTQTNPFCWIPYESVRPYLSRALVMTSDYNNALTYTMDDYFIKKMYSGDIIKTVNMKDQTLAQQVGGANREPEDLKQALKHAQDSIENQLKFFEKQLWVQPDTTIVAANKKDKKTTTTAKKDRGSSQETSKTAKTEEKKQPKPKTEKSSSTPSRSVRRTR